MKFSFSCSFRLLGLEALLVAVFTLTSFSSSAEPRFDVSGFGRVVGGYLDTDEATLDNYEDSVGFGEQSLIALQGDLYLNEKFSASAQLLAHSSNERDSGVEWAYLTYSPTEKWDIRVGRQRSLFYTYSDVIDVGFAYPWITPPRGIYSSVLFPQYEGINIKYSDLIGEVVVGTEFYWGSYDDDQTLLSTDISTNVNDYRGVVLTANYGGLSLRASYATAHINVSIDETIPLRTALTQLGFTESANTLLIDDSGQFYQLGVKYEEFDWFVEAEVNSLVSDAPLIPQRDGVAITAGYHYQSLLFYSTFSSLNSRIDENIPSEIPLGFDPQLDALAFGFSAAIDGIAIDSGQTYTIGVRYDINKHIALKGSVTHIEGETGQDSFFISTESDFNNRAQLYQFAMEFVF